MDWTIPAYETAVEAAKVGYPARRRWAGQNEWDAMNMSTEATRFPADLHEDLIRCCKEARVTRYTLIAYLLRTWMAAWDAYKDCGGH